MFDAHKVGIERGIGIDASAVFIKEYNAIHANNRDFLTYRVADPQHVGAEIDRVLEVGGTLIICDPYDWHDEFTDRSKRIDTMRSLFSRDTWEVLEENDKLALVYSPRQRSPHLLRLGMNACPERFKYFTY